jgi:hypothetical protein
VHRFAFPVTPISLWNVTRWRDQFGFPILL